jgi:hypothetical protein
MRPALLVVLSSLPAAAPLVAQGVRTGDRRIMLHVNEQSLPLLVTVAVGGSTGKVFETCSVKQAWPRMVTEIAVPGPGALQVISAELEYESPTRQR